eukprot:scaffold108638_cov39-Prasinocladus_malaysianus.AAC.3
MTDVLGLGPNALSTAPTTSSGECNEAQRLLAEMRGEAMPRSWGQPWSALVTKEAVEAGADSAIPYPEWLLGTWQVVSSFKDVKFPQGRRLEYISRPAWILVKP